MLVTTAHKTQNKTHRVVTVLKSWTPWIFSAYKNWPQIRIGVSLAWWSKLKIPMKRALKALSLQKNICPHHIISSISPSTRCSPHPARHTVCCRRIAPRWWPQKSLCCASVLRRGLRGGDPSRPARRKRSRQRRMPGTCISVYNTTYHITSHSCKNTWWQRTHTHGMCSRTFVLLLLYERKLLYCRAYCCCSYSISMLRLLAMQILKAGAA